MWAPIGERPLAVGHHRFEWLYVTGFVEPATGRTVWNVSNNISKAYFELVLVDFAKSVGAGAKKRIVLQLDNAGWHGPENLVVPDGIKLVFQPAHSPQLQPAEHLWAFVDEPLANRYFDTIEDLDQVVGERCVALMQLRRVCYGVTPSLAPPSLTVVDPRSLGYRRHRDKVERESNQRARAELCKVPRRPRERVAANSPSSALSPYEGRYWRPNPPCLCRPSVYL